MQRLCKPRVIRRPEGAKPLPLDKLHRFFGGGMLGLTEKAWDLFDPVFDIDYMGAAEYEFGTFPRAIKELIDGFRASGVVAFQFAIERKDVLPNDWGRGSLAFNRKGKKKRPPAELSRPTEPAIVYMLCRSDHATEAEAVVRRIVGGTLKVRDVTMINHALDPLDDRDRKWAGWFELDNGFFFFVDEGMWRSVCEWFGIEPAQAQSA